MKGNLNKMKKKALNKLIQGSAADMTKKSMLELYKEGIVAHIQIHDELCVSVENKSQADKIKKIMANNFVNKFTFILLIMFN